MSKNLRNEYSSKYFRDNKYLDDCLINNEIYFANLITLNDPYEYIFSIKSNSYSEIIIRYSDFEIKLKTTEEIENYFNERLELFKAYVFNQVGISCFSSMPNNHLMWSHYGDSYRGACLVFDFREDKEFSKHLDVVKYTELEAPQINLFLENNVVQEHTVLDKYVVDQLVEVIYTKPSFWSYEEEQRITMFKPGLKKFHISALKMVIFGYRMKEDRKIELAKILKEKYPNIKIYETKLNTQVYWMHFYDWETKEEIMFYKRS